MALTLRVADAAQTVSAISLLTGGVLRPVKALKVMRGGALVPVPFGIGAGLLSATAEPSSVYGFSSTYRASIVTSNTTTVTPDGGTGPYTYLWERVSGSPMTVTSPGIATTSFRATVSNNTIFAVFRCTVTDAQGAVATCTVDVELSHEGYGVGPIP